MDYAKESLKLHQEWKGKIETISRVKVKNKEDLSLAYTPGVAQPCLEIQKDPSKSFELTRRWNLVAVISDGSAVLGLGDIGPEASMPVMEGKCVLFKEFADVDAFPLCVKSKNVDEIVNTIQLISGSFGGINLEDIGAPRCFEIEEKLKAICDIPVFHDDQHGTAIVVAAGIINSLKLANKNIEDVSVVINGAGSAGIAIGKLLYNMGIGDIILCDKYGVIELGHPENNSYQEDLTSKTNKYKKSGSLADALVGADIFVGVSRAGLVSQDMVRSMNTNPIIFAMANPNPEIMPEDAKAGGAFIMGTGRSDFPNQINNVLAFPGIFRGALDIRAKEITEEMKIAAAKAIAGILGDDELSVDKVLPEPFDPRVSVAVAEAVKNANK